MGIIQEYLVALGLQDNMTDKLNQSLKNSSDKVSKFVGKNAKQWIMAGTAVTTFVATGVIGVAKFVKKIVDSEEELQNFARDLGLSRNEAFQTKSALDAMGKSMDEINASADLRKQFEMLKENAEKLKPPDMSKGIQSVRDLLKEFTTLKQTMLLGLQWIGHHLFKNLSKPFADIKGAMGGLTQTVTKNMPIWSKTAGKALASIVKLGMTIVRGAGIVFKAIKRIFDMIPGDVKLAMTAIGGLMTFIKMGPIGKLITILSIALLLLEDFFVYLDGGKSLLGPVWEILIDLAGQLEEKFISVKEYLSELCQKFQEGGAVESFQNLLSSLKDLAGEVGTSLLDIGKYIGDSFGDKGKEALNWFVSEGLPGFVQLLADGIGFVTDLLASLNEMKGLVPLVTGITTAVVGVTAVKGIAGTVTGVADAISNASGKLNTMKESVDTAKDSIHKLGKVGEIKTNLKELGTSFSDLATSVGEFATAKWNDLVDTGKLIILYGKDAIVKGASAVATWAQVAATTAWNVIASIAATVTTAFGAAVAFLTSPIGLVIIAIIALIAIVVLLVKNWDKVKEFFIKLWDKIKAVFAGIAEWFGEKFEAAKEAVYNAFAAVGEWFAEKKDQIVEAFQSIPQFLSDKFKAAVDKIKKVFSPIVDWFKEKVEAIKNFFGSIGDKIKSVHDQEPEGVNDGHAEGGVFHQEHIAHFAEGNKAEAVIPLTKPKRALQVLGQVAGYFGGNLTDDKTAAMAQKMQAFIGQASAMIETVTRNLGMNSAVLAANAGGKIVYNQQSYDQRSTFHVSDSSGTPEKTAKVIDNTQKTRQRELDIRNSKGVID